MIQPKTSAGHTHATIFLWVVTGGRNGLPCRQSGVAANQPGVGVGSQPNPRPRPTQAILRGRMPLWHAKNVTLESRVEGGMYEAAKGCKGVR